MYVVGFGLQSKRWVPSGGLKWVEFTLPSPHTVLEEGVVERWVGLMEVMLDDLRWLLQLPHHQFWSVLVYCPPLREQVLASFLKRAPRFYDPNYAFYEAHPTLWPVYKEIYLLVFRVYMRMATYKESKVKKGLIKSFVEFLSRYLSNLFLFTRRIISHPVSG